MIDSIWNQDPNVEQNEQIKLISNNNIIDRIWFQISEEESTFMEEEEEESRREEIFWLEDFLFN